MNVLVLSMRISDFNVSYTTIMHSTIHCFLKACTAASSLAHKEPVHQTRHQNDHMVNDSAKN